MNPQHQSTDAAVVVELTPIHGLRSVALDPVQLANRSAEALDNAMKAITAIANRVNTTMRDSTGQPSEVELTFGLKLNAEGQALVTKSGIEATLSVKLCWKSQG